MSLIDRLSNKLQEAENGCWEFIGCRNVKGYGSISVNGVARLAHRVCWELHFGSIPTGMLVLHECDNPACCNPRHLKLGNDQDNCDDKFAKRRNNNAKGQEHGNALLDDEKVRQIKRFLLTGQYTQTQLATMFNVTRQTIWAIHHNKAWTHIEVEHAQI